MEEEQHQDFIGVLTLIYEFSFLFHTALFWVSKLFSFQILWLIPDPVIPNGHNSATAVFSAFVCTNFCTIEAKGKTCLKRCRDHVDKRKREIRNIRV